MQPYPFFTCIHDVGFKRSFDAAQVHHGPLDPQKEVLRNGSLPGSPSGPAYSGPTHQAKSIDDWSIGPSDPILPQIAVLLVSVLQRPSIFLQHLFAPVYASNQSNIKSHNFRPVLAAIQQYITTFLGLTQHHPALSSVTIQSHLSSSSYVLLPFYFHCLFPLSKRWIWVVNHISPSIPQLVLCLRFYQHVWPWRLSRENQRSNVGKPISIPWWKRQYLLLRLQRT